MSPVSVVFYKGSETLFGNAIRLWTHSPYSHCALSFNGVSPTSDLLVEAISGFGVRQRLMPGGVPAEHWDRKDLDVTPQQCTDLYNWARGELGCGYDWSGLTWSQVLFIPREHPDKWFCSEFCAAAAARCNVHLKRPCTYSPGSLYKAL